MDIVSKARDLIVDDHNFSSSGASSTMIADHLKLVAYVRVDRVWTAVFSTPYYDCDLYRVEYDESTKIAIISRFNKKLTTTIHDE